MPTVLYWCAGAGGHAGAISPFAFVAETRQWFDGPIALSGAMGNSRAIRAARVLGADFAYIGSAFIATNEANARKTTRNMIAASSADDIVYSICSPACTATISSRPLSPRYGRTICRFPIRRK